MRLALALLALAAACGHPPETNDDGPYGEPEHGEPNITIDPTYLDFGTVASTDPADHAQTVTVGNDGDGDLHIQSIELGNPEAPFTFTLQSVLVQPGGSTAMTVDFDPVLDGTHRATLTLGCDDPQAPTVRLPVQAEGLAPALAVDPDPLDFGAVPLGCAVEAPLFLENAGSLDLTVEDIAWTAGDPAFTLPAPSTLPFTIAPGEHVPLRLAYEPAAEGAAQATLTIASDDPATPALQVTLTGTAQAEAWTVDTFTQRGTLPADVLVAVNASPGMEPYAVAGQLTAFATEALAAGDGARIALTVTDDGCLLGHWLDASTADIPAAVADLLAPAPGSNAERAFMLLETALFETAPGGCNEGFLREESRLMLVGISDEPDQSVNPWSYYVTLLQSYRDDPDDVVIGAVGGDYPGGCGEASAYTGMYEASVTTDGLFLSLCDPAWGAALTPMAAAVDGSTDRFRLALEPVPTTIAVTVDGLPESRWSYTEATREVVFDPDAVPAEGTEIAIHYAVTGACPQ